MRFYNILKSGVSVKNVALEFVQTLLRKSWQEQELSLEFSCDFVNDLLNSIGLETSITPEQVNAGGSYIWPLDQIQIYNFHYVEMVFARVEEFLQELCSLVKLQQEIFNNDLKELHANEDIESPVEYLMQLMAIWCNVFKNLQKLKELQAHKRFEEPLARINFHLLLGMHEIRKAYRLDLHLLDAICNRLYWSAVQGLFYKQTHNMIFSGLLEIFSKDFDLFYHNSAQTMNFFYDAISVEINTPTPLKIYQAFQTMLEEVETPYKSNILINFLIEPFMLEVYYNTFLAKKYKWYNKITSKNVEKIQQEAVKFLNLLQSKLISLDCFSREFMESILNLIFKSDGITSNLACNLYLNMMKRKFSEQMILKHIMDFYVAHVGSIANLKSYIGALCKNFKFVLNFNNLLEIITDGNCAEIIRLLSAHIFVIVFELKMREKDSSSKQHVQHLLQILPEILENLHCQKTEGILLKVFSLMPPEKLEKTTLDNLIHYAVGVFTHIDNNLEYPLLINIFQIFHKYLNFNQEWQHLELLSDHLLHKYREMLKDLKTKEEKQEKLITKRLLDHYTSLLKRLNILLKTKYDLFDNNYLLIIRNLSYYFLYHQDLPGFIVEEKSFIDLYVLEIIVSCILKLQKIENDQNQSYSFFPEVLELFKYLWHLIKNLEDLMKMPVMRIKTYFCCLLQLITFLPLKLDNAVYQQFVLILIHLNFKTKIFNRKDGNEMQQLHPLQALEYQRLMLRQFTEMHKYSRVVIESNSVWKLCIYYGMFKHHFQEELKSLLITLANYRLKIYKHIISVLIYNLYKQTPNLKHVTIVSILKQHKHLIDNDIQVESTQLLKVHVVLMVLQILEKALTVQHLKLGHNRLEALKHLNIFIEDLNLNQLQAQELMQQQLDKILKHLLTAEERKFVNNFENLIN